MHKARIAPPDSDEPVMMKEAVIQPAMMKASLKKAEESRSYKPLNVSSMAACSLSQGIVSVIVRPYSVYCHVPTWIDLLDPCYLF